LSRDAGRKLRLSTGSSWLAAIDSLSQGGGKKHRGEDLGAERVFHGRKGMKERDKKAHNLEMRYPVNFLGKQRKQRWRFREH